MRSRPAGSPPAPSFFRNSFLKEIGKQVKFKSDVPFTLNQPLMLKVIRDAGFDPDNLSQYGNPDEGWRLFGQQKPEGFFRRVWRLGQHLSNPKNPLLQQIDSHHWNLTEAGVIEAARLAGKILANLTAPYLEKRIKETGGLEGTLYHLLRKSVASRLPKSATAGAIEDHVQNCILRLISRDSLHNKLEAGAKIPDTLLATYAVRSGFNDIRGMGTNPITREMFGARTESEIKKNKKYTTTAVVESRAVWVRDASGIPTVSDVTKDPLTTGGMQASDEWGDFQKYMACIEVILEKKNPRDGKKYLDILRKQISGYSISEISAQVGEPCQRIQQIATEARHCLIEARRRGHLQIS